MFVTPVSASSAATGIMSGSRPLRGGCQCGRNRYIIAIPEDRVNEAQVLFNTEPQHQIPLATPLAAYIRVPLSWYHSTTYAFFPDETHSMIRRVYTHPSQDYSKRHFCGFCGTPLSYWSEDPSSEAEFINLTLGSLLREDIRDLEDIGLIPQDGDEDAPAGGEAAPAATPTKRTAIQQSFGVPWFDGLIEGSRLGNMRRSYGTRRSRDGQTSIEWDIVEFSENGGETGEGDAALTPLGKRKLREHEA